MVKLKALTFTGPAGRLEGLLKFDESVDPKALVVVCHPHPQFQGTMHNKVVFAVAETFFGLGCEVLRFNFRGVGLSAGTYDNGHGEIEDALAAAEQLRHVAPPIWQWSSPASHAIPAVGRTSPHPGRQDRAK